MIKIEELRIGNWVIWKDVLKDNHREELDPCEDEPYKLCSYDEFEWVHEFDPIPLTHEILLKCGFEEGAWFLHIPKCNLYFVWFSDTGTVELEISEGTYSPGLNYECKHLHQLQNLYYALTGKELNIEL